MLNGTSKTNEGYICLHCKKVICKHIEDINNYCPFCGAPLKLNTIVERSKFIKQEKLEAVQLLEEFYKQSGNFEKAVEQTKSYIQNN